MPELFNADGSPATGYTKLTLVSSDGTSSAAVDSSDLSALGSLSTVLTGGTTPVITSAGALTLCGSSIPLKTEAAVHKLTITPATANLINAASGTSLALQSNGTTRFSLDGTGIGFYATAPAAKQTVTGSKGANAALTSLMTALSTIGLVTDSTS